MASETKCAASGQEPEPHDSPTLRVSVAQIPQVLIDEYRADRDSQTKREGDILWWERVTTIGVGVYALVAILQWFAMTTANEHATRALQTSERAYVTFGSKSGSLAEFRDNPANTDKPIVVLHFFNAGRSTARHFAVHLAHGEIYHRHRFRGSGIISSIGSGSERDLAGGAEHVEFVTDPKWLWTTKQIADPSGFLTVLGDFEYCDIFGAYHCQGFGAQYMPSVKEFVPFGNTMPCVVESPGPRSHLPGYKEIETCEQPGEPEYIKLPPAATPQTTGTPPPAKATSVVH